MTRWEIRPTIRRTVCWAKPIWNGRKGEILKRGTLNGNTFEYEYDAFGKRYQKKVGDTTIKYYWSGEDLIAEEYNRGNTTTVLMYLYDWTGVIGVKMIGTIVGGNTHTETYWFKKNELGDVTEIYSLGGKIAEYKYDAWGNHKVYGASGASELGVITEAELYNYLTYADYNRAIPYINAIRYRGYVYDNETGFYYLNTRYYDPEIRRFINMDNPELVSQLVQTPGQLNMYAYCNNNPVAFTDPTGCGIVTAVIITYIVMSALLTASINMANAYYNDGNMVVSGVLGAYYGACLAIANFVPGHLGTFMAFVIGAKSSFVSQLISGKRIDEINYLQVIVSGVITSIVRYVTPTIPLNSESVLESSIIIGLDSLTMMLGAAISALTDLVFDRNKQDLSVQNDIISKCNVESFYFVR